MLCEVGHDSALSAYTALRPTVDACRVGVANDARSGINGESMPSLLSGIIIRRYVYIFAALMLIGVHQW